MTTKKEDLTKICKICKTEHPATLEWFHKAKNGLRPECKSCRSKSNKVKHQANKEEKNKYSREYYKNNKEKILASSKKWAESNPEKVKAISKKYYQDNKEERNAARKKWFSIEENKNKTKATTKAWREANKDQIKEKQKARRKSNPDKYKNRSLKRSGYTLEIYNSMLESQKGLCALCGTSEPGGVHNVFHADHDHKTGKTRGLLCFVCNTTLGKIEKKPADWLDKAKAYIEQGGFH